MNRMESRTALSIQACVVRVALLLAVLGLANCAQQPTKPTPEPVSAADLAPLQIHESPTDTWNAVGQVLVRTPGVTYNDRALMLGLYSIRYRDEALMVLTRGLPLSATVKTLTTEVRVTTPAWEPAQSAGAADLLATLARELPAEIESVKAQFAAEKKAKKKTKK